MRRESGFSLLEVLAALALLAILLLCVYSGVRMSSIAVRRGTEVINRLDEVRGAREFLRRELAEATALPWILDAHNAPVVFEGSSDSIRFVAPLPGYLGKDGMQVVNVRIVDEDDRQAQRIEVGFAPLPVTAAQLPSVTAEPLMEGGHGLAFRYADKDGVWSARWRDRAHLPTLIEIDAKGVEGSSWPTLAVAPRQSPWALNPATIGRALGKEGEP